MFSWLERWLVFPAPRTSPEEWVRADLPHEDVTFTGEDGTHLHGWYVPHDSPKAVILFCHGNGENVALMANTLKILHEKGVSVLAWDYRGYGKSQGQPDEANTVADARLAQLWLADRAGVRPDDIVVAGRSLGGGVAVGLASQYPVRALVLDRTFSQLVETARYHYPWLPVSWIMKNRFASIDAIKNYKGPLLQAHGTADVVVPYEMGKRLFDAAPTKNKRFITVEGGGHNDQQTPEFYQAALEFIEALPPVPSMNGASTAVDAAHAH